MSTTLIEKLVAELNGETINEALNIVRSNRPSVFGSIAGFSTPELMDAERKFQWLDYRIDARGDEFGAPADDSTTTITVKNPDKFRKRMVIRVPSTGEEMIVAGKSGSTLTVIRGYNGISQAVLVNTPIEIQSSAREENSLADTDTIDQPEKAFNHFQTIDTTLEFSDDALKVYQFGNTNDLQFQMQNQMIQLGYQLNRQLIYGTRGKFTVDGKDSYTTGGMRFFASQTGGINIDNSGQALTLDKINAVYEDVFNRGGNLNKIAVGTVLGRQLNKLVSAEYGPQRLKEWMSDQGSLVSLPSDLPLFGGVTDIVIDNNLGANELFMYDSSRIQVVPVAANNSASDGSWVTKDATMPGQDGAAVRVIGKLGFRFRDSKTHLARLHNLG